jgi:two-component system, OmpR family, sensor kinase
VFRSIRTALLFWYGVIFLLLVAAFGTTAYLRISRSIFRAVDAKLEAYAHTLAAGLEEMDDGSLDLEVPKSVRTLFRRGDDLPYYLIWDKSGKIIHRSAAAKDAPHPGSETRRSRGSSREVIVPGPKGTAVLVGGKAKEELHSLREFLAAVLFAGGVVTVIALAGGWFLTTRALRPIGRISEAASTITARDLSRRIDVAQTESELGRLARTLNETFDRLETTFNQQARFTADASHELRTPLSLVLSQAELALMKERSPEEYREALRAVERAALRMKSVVEGLLTLARADAKQLALAKEPVALAALVEETAGLLGPLAAQRKVAVTVHAQPAGVEGDRERLRDAVSNLLSNAIRYTPEGGRVDVALAAEGREAVLSVADTGIGIPEKDRPHIFERFYRVDQARARDKGGSGLGLAITKWVIEAHGGTISFASREGQGTTFTIKLPLAPAPAA